MTEIPSKTFQKLSKKKQTRVLKACFQEFSANNYKSASTNRIVRNVDIAKGSIFAYFGSKPKLYDYLFQLAYQTFEQQLQALQAADSFAKQLENIFYARMLFEIQYPLYSAFLSNYFKEIRQNDIGKGLHPNQLKLVDWLIDKIAIAQIENQCRNNLDIDLIGFFINMLLHAVPDYLNLKYQFHEMADLQNKIDKLESEKPRLQQYTRELSELVMAGLK